MIKGVWLQRFIFVTLVEKEVFVTQLNAFSVLSRLIVVVQMFHVKVFFFLAVCGAFVFRSCLRYITNVEVSKFNFEEDIWDIVDVFCHNPADMLSSYGVIFTEECLPGNYYLLSVNCQRKTLQTKETAKLTVDINFLKLILKPEVLMKYQKIVILPYLENQYSLFYLSPRQIKLKPLLGLLLSDCN